MIKRIILFQTVVLLLFMGVTQAAVTTYATRKAFDLAHPGLPVEGFEAARSELRWITGHRLVMGEGEVLDHLTDNAVFDPGDIMDGIQIFSSFAGESERLVVLGKGAYHYGFTIDSVKISNTDDASKLNLVFPGTVNAVAFDVQYGGDNVGIKAFDADGGLIEYEYEINTEFFGIYSTDPISRIEVNAPAGGDGHFEVIDNVAMGRGLKMLNFPIEKLTRRHFVFSAVTPALDKKTISVGNVTYDQYMAEGGKLIGEAGRPGLPGFCRLIVVPKGAQVQVNITKGKAQIFQDALIYPVQPERYPMPPPNPQVPPSYDQQEIEQDNLFVIDEEFYQKDFTYPKRMYDINYDWVRGCRVAIINVHTSQYNPAQKKLIHYPNMKVDIRFKGGGVTYMPINRRSVFLEDMYGEVFSNYDVIRIETSNLISRLPVSRRCDLLIITPSTFEAQANELAEWKTEKGFITKVATLEAIEADRGGRSASHIRDYIKSIYNFMNLSYVLLIGDAEYIPVHYVSPHPTAHDSTLIGTDLYYAEMDDEGYMPDLGIGRLSVDTPEQAQTVINKIINYEEIPPTDPDYYRRILHVSYFQDVDNQFNNDPSVPEFSDGYEEMYFVAFAEELRDFFSWQGYSLLPRQYTTDFSAWPSRIDPDSVWYDEYFDPDFPGPQWLKIDSAPLQIPVPSYLRYPGFPWDGSTEGIASEINNGSFLTIFVTHGGNMGWKFPRFAYSPVSLDPYQNNLLMLDNGGLPTVILSYACNTGWFDNETDDVSLDTPPTNESVAEGILRMEGGAVAVIAASRNSSGKDHPLFRGIIDSIWPGMLPVYHGDTVIEGSSRLGDALNYGKIYFSVFSELPQPEMLQTRFELYNLLGDPTMEIWTDSPYIEFPPLIDFRVLQRFVPFREAYRIPIEIDGVRVSLIDNGKIVAQGISTKGSVHLKLNKRLSAGARLSLSKRGYLTQVYPLFSQK